MKIRLEFKLQDMWLGIYWVRKHYFEGSAMHVWVCLIPCFPIHITKEKL